MYRCVVLLSNTVPKRMLTSPSGLANDGEYVGGSIAIQVALDAESARGCFGELATPENTLPKSNTLIPQCRDQVKESGGSREHWQTPRGYSALPYG
jgi:hypothetical protein